MDTFQSVVRLLSNVLDAYTVAFFQYEEGRKRFHLAAAQSLSKHLQPAVSLPEDGSGILSQVHKVGHTVHMSKVQAEKLAASLPFYREGEKGIKGLLATPVGTAKGLLYVDTKRHWGFTDKQQKWILETAEVLHMLLQQRQCVLERHSYSRILTFWHEIIQLCHQAQDLHETASGLAERAADFTGMDWAFVTALDEHAQELRFEAVSGGPTKGLLTRRIPRSSRTLVPEAMRKNKNLFISALNPDSEDHRLFFPNEALPHQGALWIFTTERPTGGTLALTLLSKKRMAWDRDQSAAVESALSIFRAFYDSLYWRDWYLRSSSLDGITGLLNEWSFIVEMERAVDLAIQESRSVHLVLVQIEPWQYAQGLFPPSLMREWEQEFARCLRDHLPSEVLVGRLASNRYAVGALDGEMKDLLMGMEALEETCRALAGPRKKRMYLSPHLGYASLPQDGVSADELWQSASKRLVSSFQRTSLRSPSSL